MFAELSTGTWVGIVVGAIMITAIAIAAICQYRDKHVENSGRLEDYDDLMSGGIQNAIKEDEGQTLRIFNIKKAEKKTWTAVIDLENNLFSILETTWVESADEQGAQTEQYALHALHPDDRYKIERLMEMDVEDTTSIFTTSVCRHLNWCETPY
jgi:Mg/Co/Ni transporter MgtE